MKEKYCFSLGGIKYRYRFDPVPDCGTDCRKKARLPYNRHTAYQDFLLDEDGRLFKDSTYKEMFASRTNGCLLCYLYFYERPTDKCWKIGFKCRKQWMKHQKKHYPTLKIKPLEKPDDDISDVD